MAESLVNTRRRIATIKSTEKITKAMKLVATVKYQRWRRYYDESRPYSSQMQRMLITTLESVPFEELSSNPYIKESEGEKTLYILVTSSLGLCGAYNYSLFKTLDPILKEGDGLYLIGTKGYTHYKNKEVEINEEYIHLLEEFRMSRVRRLRHSIVRDYKSGKYQKVVLVYTQYKNSMTFLPSLHTLLPLDVEALSLRKDSYDYEPLFEPDLNTVLENVITYSIDSQIYQRLIESELSELASRRNAMETATDAADKIVKQLQLQYNKSRQNAITQEITEVVAGANAGKKEE
ncbi:MAG: ATP synthase F1 subunit gamma [Bacilli bacterium]|nr:ATP synthase F1 subunit gamma [Bacilli bacterium]